MRNISYLDITDTMLKKHGAVSAVVAEQMVEACWKRFKTDMALSTTGVAGPTGGTPEKPVGTVWVGIAGASIPQQSTALFFPKNTRIEIRQKTMLHSFLLGLKQLPV